MKHYTDPNDFNEVICHQRNTDTEERIRQLLKDADELLDLCETSCSETTGYELFIRCLSEETVVDHGKRRIRTKADEGMVSIMHQNPSDPKATFRKKAGKEHRGYAANLEESVGSNDSLIADYQYEQNIYSDSQFLREHLERAKIQRKMSGGEFKDYARLRNGVETVPSNLRRNYHLEKIPRGKQRGKFTSVPK